MMGPTAGSGRAAFPEVETNDDFSNATWMTLNNSYYGDLGYRTGNPPDQQDYFRFNLSKDQLFSVTVSVSYSMEGLSARVYDPDQQETNASLMLMGGRQWECNRSSGSQPGVWYLVLTGTKSNYTIDTWTIAPHVDPVPKITITSPANNSVAEGLLVDVKGNASDDKAVTAVFVFPDGTFPYLWTKATGTTSWNATVNISEQAAHGGSIRLWAHVEDGDGNMNESSITVFYYNHTPRVQFTLPANNSMVSGLLVQVSGTASDDMAVSRVDVFPENATPAFWTKADGTTAWSATVNISDYAARGGPVKIWAHVEDYDFNMVESFITVYYFNNTPKISIIFPKDNDVVYQSALTVIGTASDDKAVANVDVYPEGTLEAFRSRAQGTDRWRADINLSNAAAHGGDIRIFANVTDSDNNTNETFITVHYQGYSPMIMITSPQNNSDVTDALVQVSGTASDDKAVEKVDVALEGVGPAFWTRASGTTVWNATIEISGHIDQNGAVTIWAYVTDNDENLNSTSVTVHYNASPPDRTPPSILITYPTEGLVVKDKDLTVEGVADDNEGVSEVWLRVNQEGWRNVTLVPGVGTRLHWNLSLTLPEGPCSIFAMTKDKAGHSDQTSVNFTINTTYLDTTPPELVITFPSENGTICSNTSIVVYGTAQDNAGIQKVEWWDHGPMTTWQNASTSDGWGNWSIVCPLIIGTNDMWVCATDINGLRTTCRVMVVRTEQPVHYEPPVVEITQPEDGYGQTYEQFYIAWKAHCNVSLSNYNLMINGRIYAWEDFGPNTTSVNRTFRVNLRIGYATINVTVTDITGHNGSDHIRVRRVGEVRNPLPGFEAPALACAMLAAAMVSLKRRRR
jgi:hypothetical protein